VITDHARSGRRLSPAFWLLSGQLIMFTGIAALFPIAPLYIAHRGGSSVEIALFVAGPLAANMVVQVPAGRLADRIGRRPILLGTRIVYVGLAALLFADVGPLPVLILIRALQGAASGAYVPALLAALTDITEPSRRIERFAQVQACEMVGLLLGPLLGGAAALWHDSAAFGVAGLAVLLGLLPMAGVPETMTRTPRSANAERLRWWRRRGILVPSLGLFAVGTIFAMYDVVWPQYLGARGYGPFVVGVSISLFAIPILLLARRGGRLSQRFGPRRVVPLGFVVVAATAASYPFLRSFGVITAVGEAEAVGIMFLEPGLYAVIGASVDEHNRGRAMGIGGFFQFGGSALGAGVLGSLYGLREGVPFWIGSAVLFAAGALCAVALPRGLLRVEPTQLEPQPTVREREVV